MADRFEFTPEHDGSLPIKAAVFQALGAASMCWEHPYNGGVFDDTRAAEIGEALLAVIGAKDGWDFPTELPEAAWGIIANAGGGNWENETPEWREAAERWRDAYHETLPKS